MADDAKPEPRDRRMVLDPELAAVQDMLDALKVIEVAEGPDAADRVLDYVNRRYQSRPAPKATSGPAQ